MGEDPAEAGTDGMFAGYRHEYGFREVGVDAEEPLFDGIGDVGVFHQEHYWEVKSVPAGFRALGRSDVCEVQAIAHERLPLYGTQFHPEYYDPDHRDGERVIQNFLRISGAV